ncbi:MAG: tetratricopeptide repeat protein [Gemmatimonadaceae bacterium]
MMHHIALLLVLSCAVARAATAQNYIARADSLFRSGRVFAAETLYYYAARRQPRDPAARLALGRYLAARGALKIGAVLMEEARYFGGDARAVALALAPVYARLGDYSSLAALPGSPLNTAERERAEWLGAHAPSVSGPDTAFVPLLSGGDGVGAIAIVIRGDSVLASIDPRVSGLVLDSSWAGKSGVRHFASTFEADPSAFAGVTAELQIGAMNILNTPTRFDALAGPDRALIGLDLIGRLAPTFDPGRGTILLRRDGRVPDSVAGRSVPTLAYPTGLWIIAQRELWPVGSAHTQALLNGAPWTLDARDGEILLHGGR